MTPDERALAKRWFINRFIHTITNRNFALRINNLQEMSPSERNKLASYRARNARFDFTFLDAEDQIAVMPRTPESDWVKGVIWMDKNGGFQYRTATRIDIEAGE